MQAADMLVRAMAVMDARGGESGGLLSWLTYCSAY
jgi:hypothetical protein